MCIEKLTGMDEKLTGVNEKISENHIFVNRSPVFDDNFNFRQILFTYINSELLIYNVGQSRNLSK